MAAMRTMESSSSCIACGESKEEAETLCKLCKAAFSETGTEADSFCAPCDSPEIEIATAEKKLPVSNNTYKRTREAVDSIFAPCDSQEIAIASVEKNLLVSNLYKRNRCSTESCAGCSQYLGATPTTPYCSVCESAMDEIASPEVATNSVPPPPCDSQEIEIATVEKKRPASNPYKRKRCSTESCAGCRQYLGATPTSPYCSVCESAMTEIASPEIATNSVPPQVCDSIRRRLQFDTATRRRLQFDAATRRRLQFDAAVGGVTVDLCTPKRLASSPIRNQKETIPIMERDDENLINPSLESTPGLDCEVTDVLTVEDVITQRFVEATQNGEIVDLLVDQSQESKPDLDCEVTDILTVEDIISQRFVEATQNGEIVDLLSQDECESSECAVISQQPVRRKMLEKRRILKYGISRHV
jgi:hypothetical protein